MKNGVETSADHPEELLDLACGGSISHAQWQELRPHLAVCFPCATQLRMSGRSVVDQDVKSSDIYRDRLAAYQAVERFRSSRAMLRPSFVQKLIPMGVGALLLSSAALAATWWSASHRSETPPAVSPSAHVRARAAAGEGIRSGQSQGAEDSPPIGRNLLAESTPAGTPTFGTKSHLDRSSPAELFARARALRLGGNPAGALSIYRRLQRNYADSREGRLSYLVVGRMWLERDLPDLAATQFSRYLDTEGSASEEALVGRATAFGRMGRAADEAGDWRKLLSLDPSSVYANRARTRLNELAGAPGALGSGAGHP